MVDARITCIDEGTEDLFSKIIKLVKAMLESEDGEFALYFAKESSNIFYKLFMKNQMERNDFKLNLEIDLVMSLSFRQAGL